MRWRGGCCITMLGLAGCARLVGLDDVRRGPVGSGGSTDQDSPMDSGALSASGSSAGPERLGSPPASDMAKNELGDASVTERSEEGGQPPVALGTGSVQVTLVKFGTGTVVSDPPGILCGQACSAEFLAGTPLTLEAFTENGSDTIFSSWGSETGCSTARRCALPALSVSREVSAIFRRPFNPVFASSVPVSPTLGGLSQYDRVCNELASGAGFNDVNGSQYLAVMSDELNSFRERLGSFASLWELMDGSTFASTPFALFDQDAVLRAVDLDEQGVFVSDQRERRYLTGTLADGSSAPDNCNNWTDPTLRATAGVAAGGPGSWLMGDTVACSEPQYLMCISTRLSAQIFIPDAGARPRVWLSKTRFVPGPVTPDEHCRLHIPPGITNASALVAYTDRPARETLTLGLGVEYVRLDGTLLGRAEDLVSFQTRAGIWQADDLTYLSPFRTGSSPDVWTGQADFDRVGTVASTCNDWTGTVGAGMTGRYDVHRRAFWGEQGTETGSPGRSVACADPAGAHLYCVGSVL